MWARTALLVGLVGLVSSEGALAQGPVVSWALPGPVCIEGRDRDCLLCHQAAVVSDMKRFTTSGTVQYRYAHNLGGKSVHSRGKT